MECIQETAGHGGIRLLPLLVKGRDRDTAWYAITDDDWPAIRNGFETWLAPGNMDSEGRQLRPLGELIGEARGQPR